MNADDEDKLMRIGNCMKLIAVQHKWMCFAVILVTVESSILFLAHLKEWFF